MDIFESCIASFTEDLDESFDLILDAIYDLQNVVFYDHEIHKIVNILYLEYTEATCYHRSWMLLWFKLYDSYSMLPRFRQAILEKIAEGSQHMEIYLSCDSQPVRERAIHSITFLSRLLRRIYKLGEHSEDDQLNETRLLIKTFLEDASLMIFAFPNHDNIEAVLNALKDVDGLLNDFLSPGDELHSMRSDLEDGIYFAANDI